MTFACEKNIKQSEVKVFCFQSMYRYNALLLENLHKDLGDKKTLFTLNDFLSYILHRAVQCLYL